MISITVSQSQLGPAIAELLNLSGRVMREVKVCILSLGSGGNQYVISYTPRREDAGLPELQMQEMVREKRALSFFKKKSRG